MYPLSQELKEIHESFYRDATDILENQETQEGISNLFEYLDELRDGDYSLPTRKFLEATSLRAATRVYPGDDQDIIFASLNPKIKEHPEETVDNPEHYVPSNTLKWLSQYTGSIERYAVECAEEYHYNYLDRSVTGTRKNGYHGILDLLNEFGLVSYPEGGRSEYLSNDNMGSVFSDIYFTNWHKFATKDSAEIDELPEELRELSSSCLSDELEAIEGDIVFTFGSDIQSQLEEYVIKPLTEDAPEYGSVTSTQRHGYAYHTNIANGTTLVTVNHQSQGWNQSEDDDPLAQIRDTLETINI